MQGRKPREKKQMREKGRPRLRSFSNKSSGSSATLLKPFFPTASQWYRNVMLMSVDAENRGWQTVVRAAELQTMPSWRPCIVPTTSQILTMRPTLWSSFSSSSVVVVLLAVIGSSLWRLLQPRRPSMPVELRVYWRWKSVFRNRLQRVWLPCVTLQ